MVGPSWVDRLKQRFGGIEVAGQQRRYGYRAAVEEGDELDVRALFETHVFGVVSLLKAVLPGMRARRSA